MTHHGNVIEGGLKPLRQSLHVVSAGQVGLGAEVHVLLDARAAVACLAPVEECSPPATHVGDAAVVCPRLRAGIMRHNLAEEQLVHWGVLYRQLVSTHHSDLQLMRLQMLCSILRFVISSAEADQCCTLDIAHDECHVGCMT